MPKQTALLIILIIAVAGMLFSGYLSYQEIFAKSCTLGCSANKIAGIPPCVYGLIMYTLLFFVSLAGLAS